MWSLFVLCLALHAITLANSECTLGEDVAEAEWDFPNIFDESIFGYEFSVEFNNYATQQTVFVKEYYDIKKSNGRTEIWRKGDYKDFRYHNDTNEAFTISRFQCESGKLDETDPPFTEDVPKGWIDVEMENKVIVRYLFGPSALFRDAYKAWKKDKKSIAYLGTTDTVRLIPVEKYKRCIEGNEVYYYFTVGNWVNPNGEDFQMRMPVRVTYFGKEGELVINQTYEFTQFKPLLSSPEKLRILEGRGCKRQVKNEVPVPKFINANHVARIEIVYYPIDSKNVFSHYVSTIQLAYHKISQLVMYQFAPWVTGNRKENEEPKTLDLNTTVWDNKNNVIFKMDDESGECEIHRDKEYYPSFPLPDEGDIDILHPMIFLNNTGFQYIDRTKIRGIPVLIYEQQIQDMYFGKKSVPLTVITRYYAEDDTVIGSGDPMDNIPIRINLGLYADYKKTKLNSVIVMNIFSFTTDMQYSWRLFDVSRCFKNYDEYQWFKVTFNIPSGITADSLRMETRYIQEEFLGTLYTKTDVTPARVSRILVDTTYDTLSVETLLLERPPSLLEFSIRGSEELEQYDASDTALSLEECTNACIEFEGGSECKTISFCGATCYISRTAKAKSKANDNCLTFDREKIMEGIPTLDSLLTSIKKLVESDFSLYLSVVKGDNEDHVLFKAVTYDDAIRQQGKDDSSLKERDFVRKLSGFKIVPDEKTKVTNYGKQSLSYCKRICRHNPECETISYCFATSECVTSSEYRSEIRIDSIIKNTQCVIFGRDYISSYQKHVGVALTRKAEGIFSETTADECARLCTIEKNIKCNSFDYCVNKKSCLLHTAHIFDEKEKGDSIVAALNCSHYSKKYIYEFKQIPNKRIEGDGDLIIRDVDPDECAKRCVENAAFQCQSFDYCEAKEAIDNRCILSSQGNEAKTISKSTCRRFYRGVGVQKSTSYHSNSLAAGLGILFFIIGSIVGIGGTYAFGMYKSKRYNR